MNPSRQPSEFRLLSQSLSGYLCGTHSGALARRRGARLREPPELARRHAALRGGAPGSSAARHGSFASSNWRPVPETRRLAERLRADLAGGEVIDLLVFGSQAGGEVTGYSDLDAVLVIDDDMAERPGALRPLRARVLRAQRAVLRHQPMQHHGFEVVTPTLLEAAPASLAMPEVAFERSASLLGSGGVPFGAASGDRDPAAAVGAMCARLEGQAEWPRHPWSLHALVSQFALLPALFEQVEDQRVGKAESFALTIDRFPWSAPAFESLRQVREQWPRRSFAGLNPGLSAARNPWLAIDAWRRLPFARAHATPELTGQVLEDLRRLSGEMAARISSGERGALGQSARP